MANKKKEVKVESNETAEDEAPSSLRRSSRSTRGSVKPVVDLTKSEKEVKKATEDKKTRQKSAAKKIPMTNVKKDPDADIVDLVNMSEEEDDEQDDKDVQIIKDKKRKETAELEEDEEEEEEPEEEEEEEDDDDDDDEDFEEPKSRRGSRRSSAITSSKKKQQQPAKLKKEAKKPANNKTPKGKANAETVDKKSTSIDHSKLDEVEVLYELTEKEMKECNQAFSTNCSPDSDETLSPEELKTAIRALGFEPRADEIQKLIKKFSPRSGKINRDCFHKIMAFKMGSAPGRSGDNSSNDEISKVFNLLDLDKTGMITMENLRSISKELNEDINDEELQEMISEADLDGDFMINKQEFYNIMKKTSLY